MVDSRQIHPATVIDLNSRKKGLKSKKMETPNKETSAPPVEVELGKFPLTLPFLMDRLANGSDHVKMWAAYQLVDHWQGELERFIELMWNSSIPEIQESAIHLVSMNRLHHYAFPLLRIFNSNEKGLIIAAGQALGNLHYEPAVKTLQDWFQAIFNSQDSNLVELEASAKSLILLDNRRYWEEIFGKLEECHQNHSMFSVLFTTLALHCESADQVERLVRSYKIPREIFHDFRLAHDLVEVFGLPNLSRYMQSRLNGGYSLSAVYQEALQVLGFETSNPEIHQIMERMAGISKSQTDLEEFLQLAEEMIDLMAPEEPESEIVLALMKGAASWVKCWDEATLKVREVEYHLLISLPLVTILSRAERECLEDPVNNAHRIVSIYQSPLLTPVFLGKVLNIISSREGAPVMARLGAGPLSGWLRDEEKDALWKLITGKLDDVDYPFEQILPRPWEFRNPIVMSRLIEILKNRFPQYLESGREQTVDYCLEVFRRDGSEDLLEIMLENFNKLINTHYSGFIEFINHIPDQGFLAPLINHYQKDEFELGRLIRFICDVHHLPDPEDLQEAPEKIYAGKMPATVRLLCPSCSFSYQYVLDVLYVDEERIEQRQIPCAHDIWSPQPFHCKKCNSEVPFEPEEAYLQDLFSELLAARLLHLTNQEESVLNHIHLIPFPVLNGKTHHPGNFLSEVEKTLRLCASPADEVPYLMELGKFYLEIGELGQAKQTFQKVQAGPVNFSMALYYLGIIAFQEKSPYDARVCFSRFVDSNNKEDFKQELDNPVDMAKHYLKLLERQDFKRSHFRLIST